MEGVGLDPEKRQECSEYNAEKICQTMLHLTQVRVLRMEIGLSCHIGCPTPTRALAHYRHSVSYLKEQGNLFGGETCSDTEYMVCTDAFLGS